MPKASSFTQPLATLAATALGLTFGVAPLAAADNEPKHTEDPTNVQQLDVAAPPRFPVIQLEEMPHTAALTSTTAQVDAWPQPSVLASLNDGQRVPLVRLGTARASADGTIDISPLVRAAHEKGVPDGEFNVQISTETPTRSYLTNLPVSTASARTGSKRSTEFALNVRPVTPQATSPLSAWQTNRANSGSMVTPAAYYCNTFKDKDVGRSWSKVGATYIGAPGVTANYEFTSGAKVTTGLAISPTGAAGSFSANGSVETQSDVSFAFPARTSGNTGYYVEMVLTRYRTVCTNGDTGQTRVTYQARASRLSGGSKYSDSQSGFSENQYCTGLPKGLAWSRNNTAAATWGGGFQTSGLLGLNLTSQSGFTSTSKQTYKATSNRQICGWRDFPGGSPQNVKVIP